jgi:hypothetical protein
MKLVASSRLKSLWRSLLKRVTIFTVFVLIALGAASQAHSFAQQQQPQQQKQRPKRPAAAKPKPTPAPDMRAEAAQVAAQIKNVSNFIYIYGKVVNGLEIDEDQVKRQETSPEIQARNKKSKDLLIARIRDVRAGLENLANGFQANPRLQVQLLKLNYATGASLDAERYAATGQYEEAGKSLVAVVERLTDTIISMRLL